MPQYFGKYVIIIFLIIIIIIIYAIYTTYTFYTNNTADEEKILPPVLYNGVCVFDLDNTITCGIKNARDAINLCKENNYKIAINTARITPYYEDIKLNDLGLDKNDFIDDFYYGEQPLCSFIDQECLSKSIASVKTKHLYTLAKKYDLDHKKIILFDDLYDNIEDAKNNGFSTIFANNPTCGLRNNVSEQLENIFKNN